MKVLVTEEALKDLARIGREIRKDSPRRAERFVAEIYERWLRLSEMPRAYPLVPWHEDSGIRRRVHGNYLIFYRVGTENIEVLHVLHGAQDYERILFSDE